SVYARIGHHIQPLAQLSIQVVEIAERAGEEEILADIAIGSLDLSLCFGPIRTAGLGLETIMSGEVDQPLVVDDAASGFADDGGLHAVVKDLMRDAADCLECRDMAAQDLLHVLVQDKTRPNQPAEAEHKGEQPDDAGDRRFISELHLELSKVDLGLVTRRRLEADFEGS